MEIRILDNILFDDYNVTEFTDNLQLNLDTLSKFLPFKGFNNHESTLLNALASLLHNSHIPLSSLGLRSNPFTDHMNFIGFILNDSIQASVESNEEAQELFFKIFRDIRQFFTFIAKHPESKLTEEQLNIVTGLILKPLKEMAKLLEIDSERPLPDIAENQE
ncbi:MAG: hypothetical protein ABI721_04035 [Candidatus Dojkabacteria bacterium]